MKKAMCLLLSALLLTLVACQPVSQNTPNQQKNTALSPELSKKIDDFYKNWDQGQIKLSNGSFANYYSLIRKKSVSLLVFLDGSGYESVMGVKNGNNWIKPGNAYSLAKIQFSDFDFLTVDKLNVTMGGEHLNDPAVINNYTFDCRVNSAISAIDNFLKDKKYKQVFLFGISEGGQILPKVYTQLKQKDKITKLVVLGAGGLSQYEQFKTLKESNLPMQPGFKEAYSHIEEAYQDIINNPESMEKQYFGYTYKRWYGFMKYRPMDDYITIDIPILMLHGAKDTNSPVESSRAVEVEFKKLGKSNLKYIEYTDMGHGPENKEQNNLVFRTINNWLKGI